MRVPQRCYACFEFDVQQPDGLGLLRVDVGFALRQRRAPLHSWGAAELRHELRHAVQHRQYELAAAAERIRSAGRSLGEGR